MRPKLPPFVARLFPVRALPVVLGVGCLAIGGPLTGMLWLALLTSDQTSDVSQWLLAPSGPLLILGGPGCLLLGIWLCCPDPPRPRQAKEPSPQRAVPRPRFRLGTLMAVVAGVAVAGAFWRRVESFEALHEYHRASRRAMLLNTTGTYSGHEGDRGRWYHEPGMIEFTEREYALFDWHFALAKKYEQAARRPWLPVDPDPPEPK